MAVSALSTLVEDCGLELLKNSTWTGSENVSSSLVYGTDILYFVFISFTGVYFVCITFETCIFFRWSAYLYF